MYVCMVCVIAGIEVGRRNQLQGCSFGLMFSQCSERCYTRIRASQHPLFAEGHRSCCYGVLYS